MTRDLITTKVDTARNLLAQARDAVDAKQVADMAKAAEVYAKRQRLSLEAINYAIGVKVDALTLMGEFLKSGIKNTGAKGLPGGGTRGSKKEPRVMTPTLASSGITKKESSDSQFLSTVKNELPQLHEQVRLGIKPLSWARKEYRQANDKTKRHAESKECCTADDLQSLIDSGKKFGTIYADPPWPYSNQATRASTDNHYDVMTLDDIAAMPIGELSAEEAHLHLWTTNAFLFDAKAILDAWGFEYKSVFVWVKPQMGIGNYWRVSHEFMLLGVRGSCSFQDKSLKSWLEANRTKHSSKPHKVRKMIELASPGPRLELFARYLSDGWTVWGNQITRTMFDEQL